MTLKQTYPRWLDVMPCYLSVQDESLRIIEANKLFRRDFGAVLGQYCYRVYKKRESPCPNCPVLRTFETGKNHTSEEIVFTKRGDKANVLVTSTPLTDRRGKIVAVVEMSTNVTEIKTLNQQLERSKRDFERLFDLVPCYITVQDRDFRIVQSNAQFREDFGESAGKHCYRIYKHREEVCPECPVNKTFADGAVHSSEETVITRDGRRANMVVYSTAIPDENGDISAVMEVSTNITEVKRLQALASVGLAVTGMAHRIKNILMGLKGGVFIVNEGFEQNDESAVDEGWEMVERNVDKVSGVAADLLFCSKDRRPKLSPDVSPQEILGQIYDLYRLRASVDGIELRLELDDPPHRGTFDVEGLHSLVQNLAANAMDACRFDTNAGDKQHVIVLRCWQEGASSTVIEVSDNGAGIPDELRPKVFESFFSTKGTEGTGLGLLVVQKVVQEHGGTISFTSRKGEGTTFRVVLPRRGGVS